MATKTASIRPEEATVVVCNQPTGPRANLKPNEVKPSENWGRGDTKCSDLVQRIHWIV